MTSGSLAPNAVDLTECCSNLFTLADINGLKWCKYTGNSCSLDSPLDDAVLVSFSTALDNNVLCSWRHAPPLVSHKLNQGLLCSESPKELWLFWYGDDPRTINIVDKNLKESDHGSWESGFPNEAKTLLFKALHNTLERNLLSKDHVRVGKWFVNLDKKSTSKDRAQLFFSFAFCLQGESKICMTVDVKQLPGVRHLVPNDLTRAAAVQGDFKVILGPYGISASLTGHSYQLNGVGVNKLVDEWKRFYPLNVVDDWTNVPEGEEHDVPVVVGVMVGDNFIKYPSYYVLISLEDEAKSDCCGQTSLKPSTLNSPLFPMTPPASPFPPKSAEQMKSRRASAEREQSRGNRGHAGKVADAKEVARELINESWRDITATKSTNKSSGVSSSQAKSFSSNFKSDQDPLWNFKEPLSRKSCSCTSSSNISRSRVPAPARSPFGINRPSPSPGSQSNQNTLASKIKKDKERKPILPFHQRPLPTKFRPVRPASKGLSTCNVATHVADQNRQPNSQSETTTKAATTTKVTKASDEQLRPKPKSSSWTDVPFTDNNNAINNNNNNETCLKGIPPLLTKLSDVKTTCDEDLYHGYKVRAKFTQNIWKCYNIFTADSKQMPRLPEDVLDLRDQRLPLTTENVVSMPEDGEVFTIETIENENYHNKRPAREDPVPEVPIPPKRRRQSSSSGRSRSETAGKTRTSRSNSSSKSQIPTPSPELSNSDADVSEQATVHQTSHTRANGNSSGGSTAGSPAQPDRVTKPNRVKSRRTSRKSQDRNKTKEVVKQESAPEPAPPVLASPPTPKGSVSLRTEKDLQVTLSDLDKLFDSPDEDEDDSKTRGTLLCHDDFSPPVHHGNEESNYKSKNNANTGPGVVNHADLARMFPTPPTIENNPHSPPANNNMESHYPLVVSVATPPEYERHSGMSYGDNAKTEKEKRKDILSSLKELPSIFEVPMQQEFLSSFSPVKSLPSSRLPHIELTNMIYTPSTSNSKTTFSKRDSTSSFCGVVSINVQNEDGADIAIPDFGQSSSTSKIHVYSPSAKEMCVERPRTKYTPLGERSCNLLSANLFLSDSYINYLSDRSLDCTDACVCQVGERKLAARHLSICKEPVGFAGGNDVCSCGLRTFEGEKLREYGGLFAADVRNVGSCMDDLGVTLDERYFDKVDEVCPVEKKGQVVKVKKETEDVKPCESGDLRVASNAASLVEYLLDQFSSPLSAAATSEKLALTTDGEEKEEGPSWLTSVTDAENFAKNAVDFLFDLKSVIQESLHKAIRWKTWEQLSSVQGPLSLKQVCQVNSKGTINATDPARIPRVIVGHDSDWLSLSPLALQYWEKLLLEPYTSSRDVAYVVLAPDNDTTIGNVKLYFKELSATYESCRLGHHVPITKVSSITKVLRDGILRIGQTSSSKYGKNAVSDWFGKHDNTPEGTRLKLFAQVCKYELGPFLEKLKLDRQLMNHEKNDENKCAATDFVSHVTSDGEQVGLREEDPAPPSIVVYIVNPFDESEDRSLRTDSYFGLLRSFAEMASALPQKIKNHVVLEIIPLRQVTQVDAYQKTKGSHVSFVKLLKTTAFSVFSRSRLVLQYPYNTRAHTGFWATPSQTNKNQSLEKSTTCVYSPPYILATPTKLIHRVETVNSPADLTLHKESSNLLFCCYGLSRDHRWLLGICTNGTGLIMETFVTVVEPFGTVGKHRHTRLRLKALKRLWEFCQGVTSCIVGQWRLVVGKLGRFSRNELRDWDEIIRTQSSTENAEPCQACSSRQSHARFQSVSVVSLHNEMCLRVHLAKVSSSFTSYREPNMAVVEPVSRPRVSTTFIVINVESSQMSHLSQLDGSIREIDSRGDLVDSDILMAEPPTEDDDEISLIPLFGSMANIFSSSKTSHLHPELRGASPNERPSSAPMLTDRVSSPFVPIGLHSPHQSQQSGSSDDQSDQEKNLGFPLAHGRMFTTAPLGPVFKQFSRARDPDENSPVVLKASLLAHHVDDNGRHGNDVLSSDVHTSVLRYILEHYDALSWLSVDSVSKDRTSCLPIHYTVLSQMAQAFNGLLT